VPPAAGRLLVGDRPEDLRLAGFEALADDPLGRVDAAQSLDPDGSGAGIQR
jgi:hypothetical protein